MNTILILTDFSEASYYAASYACVLAKQLSVPNIVLYHSSRTIVSPGESVMYIGDEKSLDEVVKKSLTELAASLADQVPQGSDLRFRTDANSLEDINIITNAESAGMIVMGTTGKGKLEAIVAGSNAIKVCEVSNVPVVLVPEHIAMQPVGNIIFACDLKDIENCSPQGKINEILNTFCVHLSVLHVGDGSGEVSVDDSDANRQLHEWLKEYRPVYHEITNDDIASGILDFAAQAPDSLILLVAKKHGFPGGLFHKSITKQLAFESKVPLLVFREKDDDTTYPVMPLLEI